jgi:putative flippase GtrA
MTSGPVAAFLARPGARQFLKFCLVGASSFVIDFGLLNLLHYRGGLSVALAATISFFCAICNGFYWNRRWTFKGQAGDIHKQFSLFVGTNLVGWILNLTIMTLVLMIGGSLGWMKINRSAWDIARMIAFREGNDHINPLALNGAKMIATAIVLVWNFTAARLWTFRAQPEEPRSTSVAPVESRAR